VVEVGKVMFYQEEHLFFFYMMKLLVMVTIDYPYFGNQQPPTKKDSTSRCNFSFRPCNVHFFLGSLGWYFSWWWRHHGGFRKCQLPQNLFDFKLHFVRESLETLLNIVPFFIDRKTMVITFFAHM